MSHGRLTPSPGREGGAPRRATWEEALDLAEGLLHDVADSPTIETTHPIAGTAEFKAAAVRVGKLVKTG
jgi:hypothetical protein